MLGLLLVDDHAVVREGYRRLLERRSDLRIVGEAGDAAEGYRLYKECGPDVAILDLSLPDTGGIELIKRLIQRDPQARILAFSMHRDPLFATQALRAGALGYVTKSSSPDILIQAVYQVAARQRVLSPDIAPDMALTLLDGAADPFRELSPREFEVLRLVLDGHNAEEIGEALHISPKTAQNIHYQVKAKLGVRTDIELMRLALRQNLVQ
ncbi:MAG: response regulator transcription factor [Betaproteobacteria bacterium]|nr:response regulator transcription factor [Betaproteobacteria bacterium]MBK8917617.1 response regulator transcription factor [Betaproteobacteria bacterium]